MLRAYLWVASAVPVASPGQVSPVLPSCGEASGSIVGPPFKQRWKLETGERVAPPCAGWASTASSSVQEDGIQASKTSLRTYIWQGRATHVYTQTRDNMYVALPCQTSPFVYHLAQTQLVIFT